MTIILKSLNSLMSRAFLFIFIKCLAVVVFFLGAFLASAAIFFNNLSITSIGFIDSAIGYLGNGIASILAWFMFPVLLPVIAGFFCDAIALLIEKKDYPDTLKPSDQPFLPKLIRGTRFLLKSLLLNIIFLPLYIIPVINVAAYYLLNSYLLGREFFETVGERYIDVKTLIKLRKSNRLRIMSIGFLITLMATIPFINLVSPLLAIVLMVHLFYELRRV